MFFCNILLQREGGNSEGPVLAGEKFSHMMTTLYDSLDIHPDLQEVRRIVRAQSNTSFPYLDKALENLLRSNGKMLRPAFLILASRFGSPEKLDIHYLAAAVELLHIATLVHDDIIDEAATRRGTPTLHTIYGKKQAVLLGDYLFSRSFRLASRRTEDITVGRYISNIVEHVCESELRQNSGTFQLDIDFSEYHRRITGKTAGLFAVSCFAGAWESGVDERTARRLRKIGQNVGVGFQIIDDILDYQQKKQQTGKPAGTDIRQGIVNLPLLCAFRKDDGTLRKLFQPPVRKKKVRRIMERVTELGGIDEARRTAAAYTEKALHSVDLLPEGRAREDLRSLVETMLRRDY